MSGVAEFFNKLLKGNIILDSFKQLIADIFPNKTTLYIWNMDSTSSESQTDIVGGKALAVTAGALTAGNDVLGNSKYCAFDGSTYLSSADAAFNFTGDFSIGGWFYSTDWSPAGNMTLLSRWSSVGAFNGWMFDIKTAGELRLDCWNAGDATYSNTVDINNLTTSAWHHFVLTRDSGTGCKIYVDGKLVSSGTTGGGAIAAAGNLEVGSYNAGSGLFTGRMDEVFIHNATVLTADQVKKIYARSAKKFANTDANGNIFVADDNVQKLSSGVYTPTLTKTTNIAASTAYPVSWSRSGNVVTCGIRIEISPTAAASTPSVLTISLPISCSSTPTGSGSANDGDHNQGGFCLPHSSTTFRLYFPALNVANVTWAGILQYVIN